jgi:hypothetical protein
VSVTRYPFVNRLSDNVHWVHEAPELTAGQRGVSTANNTPAPFTACGGKAAQSGRRMNPLLSDRALLNQRDLVAERFPKDRLLARGAAAQSGGIGAEHRHLARAFRSRTPASSSRRRTAAAAVTIIPFAHVR